MNAPIVHINGWPGCGKLTIARALRDRIGACLIRNHLILDPASALFERGTEARAALRERLRDVIYEAAADLPEDRPIIVTDALAETDRTGPLFEKTASLAARTNRPLRAVVLDIAEDENVARLMSAERYGTSKLTEPDTLRTLRVQHELMHLPGAPRFDVTALAPDEAAGRIAEWLEGFDA